VPVLVDTTPLRVSRDFRLLWLGQAVSFVGSTVTMAALPYQVFRLTGSSLAVGLLGLAQLVPLLAFSLLGGALADSLDKRRLLLTVNVASLACSLALAANAALDSPQLWLLYVVGAASSGATAVSYPTTRSLLPLLLAEDLRPAAYSLQATYGSFGMMAGPALGGVLIAAFGLTTAYLVDTGTYVVTLMAFAAMAPAPPMAGVARASRASILEGLRFLRGHSVVMSIFAIDLLAMVFGMPRALFPALSERLGGGPTLYGLLLAAVAAGAFLASISSGWTGTVRHQGRAVIVAVAVWGAAIAGAGAIRMPVPVLLLLAVAGAADMVSGVFRSTVWNQTIPEGMRGRLAGIEMLSYSLGPLGGQVRAGATADLWTVRGAISSGGFACIAGVGITALALRDFWTYDARTDEHAVAERTVRAAQGEQGAERGEESPADR
jgi:MFS family permease